ncbi:hypothetical protein [Exiguobacterium alkaliphilum]|uniref:hypothetical protein n=1 Tax=Exiguobacterium alkaliphilum TaxID=1428684 RepID=UPI00403A9219
MVTKETRIKQLLEQDDVHWRWRWGVWFVGIVVTIIVSGASPRWVPFSTLILFFPYLCLEWRKTKLLLTFNEERRYSRLIYFEFASLWLQFVVYLGLVIGYLAESLSLPWLLGIIGGVSTLTFGVSRFLQRRIRQIDPAHVTNKQLSVAKEERLEAYRAGL